MKDRTNALLGATILCAAVVAAAAPALGAEALPPDPGWPRVFKKSGKQVTVYQPQVDYWRDYVNLHFRAAIAVEGGGLKEETFGVAEVEAVTLTDLDHRTVAVTPTTRDVRFPNTPEAEATLARKIANEVHPFGQVTTISLDRVLAYVDPAQQPQQVTVELNLDPPTIFYSAVPAVLVIFMGEPQLVAVAPERKDLMFAVNTNWDVLYDQASARWFLLAGEGWLRAPDAIEGPWTPVKELPVAFSTLPADDNWAEARKRIPAKPLEVVPVVYASAKPAELILTKGEPTYQPVPDTALNQVTNTESALFHHTREDRFYFLVAGRWFRAASLDGPWTVASRDLPADFAQISDDHPAAFVKASVPGTRAAQDAVLLASIPNKITVENKPVTEQVIYSGDPKFVAVEGTTVQSAVNTPMSVFLVDGDYYWCYQGAWLQSTSPNGPWTFSTSVPTAIYSIPPSHPSYNVTYVTVYNSAPATSTAPATVTYSQTSGYSGEYVASTGVLMFGVGLLAGAALAGSSTSTYYYPYHYPYYYPPPHYYAYGGAVTYNHAYGGYYTGAAAYGPYGEPAGLPATTRPPALTRAGPPPTAPTAPPVTRRLTTPTPEPTPRAARSRPLTARRRADRPTTRPPARTPRAGAPTPPMDRRGASTPRRGESRRGEATARANTARRRESRPAQALGRQPGIPSRARARPPRPSPVTSTSVTTTPSTRGNPTAAGAATPEAAGSRSSRHSPRAASRRRPALNRALKSARNRHSSRRKRAVSSARNRHSRRRKRAVSNAHNRHSSRRKRAVSNAHSRPNRPRRGAPNRPRGACSNAPPARPPPAVAVRRSSSSIRRRRRASTAMRRASAPRSSARQAEARAVRAGHSGRAAGAEGSSVPYASLTWRREGECATLSVPSARRPARLVAALAGSGCTGDATTAATTAADPEPAPSATAPTADPSPAAEGPQSFLDQDAARLTALNQPFFGDFDAMLERRVIRAVVTYNHTHYFLDGPEQRGIAYEGLQLFQKHLNEKHKTGHRPIQIIIIPVTRDQLLPRLEAGLADIAAGALTITEERRKTVDFALPGATGVREVVVTGPAGPATLASADDLAGVEVWARRSSSYYESLISLNEKLARSGKAPVTIRTAEESFESEDLLEMVNAGLYGAVVVDEYLADFWSEIFPEIRVHKGVALREGGEIAWALRRDTPTLMAQTNEFVAANRQGSVTGNVVFKRYLKTTKFARNAYAPADIARFQELIGLFRKYADRYRFDWLFCAAQAYQESRLDQSMRSPVGAIGIMQVMPATANDPAVAIPGIEQLEPNIHAGIKYLRYTVDTFFADPAIDPLNQHLFALRVLQRGTPPHRSTAPGGGCRGARSERLVQQRRAGGRAPRRARAGPVRRQHLQVLRRLQDAHRAAGAHGEVWYCSSLTVNSVTGQVPPSLLPFSFGTFVFTFLSVNGRVPRLSTTTSPALLMLTFAAAMSWPWPLPSSSSWISSVPNSCVLERVFRINSYIWSGRSVTARIIRPPFSVSIERMTPTG